MVTLILAGVILYLLLPVLLPFVIAGAIAYVSEPAVEWLTARMRWPRWVSAALTFVLLIALFAALGWLALPSLVHEVVAVLTNLQEILQRGISKVVGTGSIDLLGRSATAEDLAASAVDWLRGWLRSGSFLAFATVGSLAFFGVFLCLVLLLYFLVSGPQIGAGLLWLVPPAQRPFVQRTWSRVDPVLRRYVIGVAAVVCYASAASYLGLAVFLDLPGALFLAMLTGILELVPMIGPATSAVLAGLVAIQAATGAGAIVAYAVYATLLRLSIDQVIGPLVMGRASYLHPVLVMFCYLAGGYLGGVVGFIMAVPVALTIRIVLQELYEGPENSGESGAAASSEPEDVSTGQEGRSVSLHPALGARRRRNR